MNSPASRLHRVLALCKKHAKEYGTGPMLAGWRKVFGMAEDATDFAVLERIGKVHALDSEIAELVGRFDDLDPRLHLGWREELEEAFLNVSLHAEFGSFANSIPRTLLVNLEFCANALAERCPEPIVDPVELIEINKLADEIARDVSQSDLDETAKGYFGDYLRLIRRAGEDYMLSGAPALQGALDACTGTLVTKRRISISTRETLIGKRFWNLTGRVAQALSPQMDEGTQFRERQG